MLKINTTNDLLKQTFVQKNCILCWGKNKLNKKDKKEKDDEKDKRWQRK